MSTDTLATLFQYKQWIDSETLRAIATVEAAAYAENHRLVHRLMNHIYVVDSIFKANLTGQSHGYTALNTPETPTTDELMAAMTACADWYIQYVRTMRAVDLTKIITFRFVDGGLGEMSVIDMLNHVLLHGTYHRGAVGWLLSQSGVTPPKDVLTVFLRDHHHKG